jgi:hypothetical protein
MLAERIIGNHRAEQDYGCTIVFLVRESRESRAFIRAD